MSILVDSAETLFEVVINVEEQYSIWPTEKELPIGWKIAGMRDTKAACLQYINENWTDMRPFSLRKQMDSDRH
jgi:MbtH protein